MLILFAAALWLTSTLLMRLVRGWTIGNHQRHTDRRDTLRLTLAGLLIGVLGDRIGAPWWAYYSVPVIALLTLVPPLRFGLAGPVPHRPSGASPTHGRAAKANAVGPAASTRHCPTRGRALAYLTLRLITLPPTYALTALVITIVILPIATRIPVRRTFEAGTTLAWSHEVAAPHSLRLVPDPAAPGNTVARFELRPGDRPVNLGHCAELSDFAFKAPFGREIHYSFRTYIPEDWRDQDVRCLIAQWHAWHDWVLVEALRSPVLGIEYRDGAFLIRSCHSDRLRQSDNAQAGINKRVHYVGGDHAQKGIWHHFDVHVRWSWRDDGELRVRIDDHLVVDYRGPIGYRDLLGPYFKFGLYRDPTADTVVIYHDDYERRMGE